MSFRLEGDLTARLNTMGPKIKHGMVAAANYVAPQAEAYMKGNATWTDQTGNARNGLGAKVEVNTNTVAIVLFHSMPYGIWLEVRWGGKYAIIEPTIALFGPKFAEAVGRLAFDGV